MSLAPNKTAQHFMQPTALRLEGKQRQQWLDLLYEISMEQSIIGASRHLLYIGKKAQEI